MSTEQELLSLIHPGASLDISKIPLLYLAEFGKKIDQHGHKKLITFLESLSSFQIRKEGNQNYLHRSFSSLPPKGKGKKEKVVKPQTPSQPIRNRATVETSAPPALDKDKYKAIAAKVLKSVKLNDRNESTVPLTVITSALHCSQQNVHRNQLSSFVFENEGFEEETHHSLITECDVLNHADVGLNMIGKAQNASERAVYLNTHEPFCAICIGVQGAGKSHTMNVILESCVLGTVLAEDNPIVSNVQPMCGLVLHYDQSQSNVCEAVGLMSHASRLGEFPELKVNKLIVLVSPTFYKQRKAFYGDQCHVFPLLFDWDSLTATQLKKLMRLSDTDTQLYVSVILNKLREYQRKNKIPSFEGFQEEVLELCNVQGQSGPLVQVKYAEFCCFLTILL